MGNNLTGKFSDALFSVFVYFLLKFMFSLVPHIFFCWISGLYNTISFLSQAWLLASPFAGKIEKSGIFLKINFYSLETETEVL